MRNFAIGMTLLLATAALIAVAPSAAAGSCTSLTDETCEHFVCIGRTTHTYPSPREECKVDNEDLPNPCGPDAYCEPGELP